MNNVLFSKSWHAKKKAESKRVHVMVGRVHMLLSIPPKNAVANVVGYIKGKSSIHIARIFKGKERNFTGESFWARGYFVSTVGRDEAMIRTYIRDQEKEDVRLDQMKLFSFTALGGLPSDLRLCRRCMTYSKLGIISYIEKA